MRNAISYWAMRVAISGIVDDAVLQAIERLHRIDHVALPVGADARRIVDVQHRIALGAELDALEAAGQKAAVPLPGRDRLLLPAVPVEVSTTKPGRLSLSLPRPYSSHEPIAGRPEIVVPVFMKVWAGSWLIASVLHRADDADLVGDRAEVREDLADLLARFLPNLLERMLRREAVELLPLKLGDRLALGERLGHRLAVHLRQLAACSRRFPGATARRPCRAR